MKELYNTFMQNYFSDSLTLHVIFFRLFLSVIFGGLVGMEREKSNRPAGFRTHILVCFGSAIVSMVQDQLRLNILHLAQIDPVAASYMRSDLGRLGAQVISGIGFLGAGSIIKGKGENTVGGLTTAAGIWATGCVGLGIGWGYYNLAFAAIIYMIIVMIFFKKIESKWLRKVSLLNFVVKCKSENDFTSGILACYEVFRQKGIDIIEIDKDYENYTLIFSVSLRGKSNISNVVVSLSAIPEVEYVKDSV